MHEADQCGLVTGVGLAGDVGDRAVVGIEPLIKKRLAKPLWMGPR